MKKNKSILSDRSEKKKSLSSAPLPELVSKPNWFKLTRLDYLLAPLVAILAGIWIFPYVGTSVNWDDLFYMNLSQYTTPQGWVLNRYGHIYLQKFFFWLVGDALTGTRLYWCFLFCATCVLVYWCAKMLAGKKGYIVGLVAVLFFCAQPVFTRFVGCTLADFTVMLLVALGTFVYLAFLPAKHKHRHFVIIIMGLIFFWAVKSKETGICLAVLFLGLGQDESGNRNIGRFVRDIGWACLGMFAGCVLLIALDMAFMGDAWFSVRPSNITELFEFMSGEWQHDQKSTSLYTLLSSSPILPAFLLYLFVGWKTLDRNLSTHERMAWLIPLALMFFLTAIIVQARYVPHRRYFMPAIPGLCIWAAQFFRFRLTESEESVSHSKILIGALIVLSAFIIVLFMMNKMPDITKSAGWKSLNRIYACVILPTATTGLLICVSLLKKRGQLALFLLSLCLFFIIYFPLKNNLTSLKQRGVAKRSEWRYEPYRIFADELRLFDKNVTILVSKDVHKRSWMLGRDVRSHCWMFNVFFNQKFDYDNFIDGSLEDILKGNYTYAFLTWRDWKGIHEKYNVEHLTKNYDVESHKATQLILLKKR